MLVSHVLAVVEPGDAQLGAANLMAALAEHGVESHVLAGQATTEGLDLFHARGIAIEAWNRRADLQYACSPAFAAWLAPRLEQADLVHAHMFGGWWAAAEAAAPGVPLVASEHGCVRWPGRPRADAMRRALARVDRFHAHGRAAAELAALLGMPESRMREGICPVDLRPRPPWADLPRRRVIFNGRLHAEEGPDVLLEALALMQRPPHAYLLGCGPMESALRRQATALRLDRAVTFCGWQDDQAAWVVGAAACVVPFRQDVRSHSAVLAMGHGTPVVGTWVEGLPEVLGDGRGLLVEPDDPEALATALQELLSGHVRPDLAAARDYARDFSPEVVAAAYAAEYAQLAPAWRAAA